MSLKKNILTGVFSAVAVLGLGSIAMAQESTVPTRPDGMQKQERKEGEFGRRGGFGKRGGRHGGGFGMGELRGLNLTDAQKEQIRTIRESKRQNAEAMKANGEEMRQMKEARRNGTLTAEQEAKMKAFHEARRAEMEKTRAEILAILTPEQKAQLEQMKQERKRRGEEFRQKRQEKMKTETPQNN